jgi:hypothetical protein
MLSNYHEALAFVDDYFTLDYEAFLLRTFPAGRANSNGRCCPSSSGSCSAACRWNKCRSSRTTQ